MLHKPSLMRSSFQNVRRKSHTILLTCKSQSMSSLLTQRMRHTHLHQPFLGTHQEITISLQSFQFRILLLLLDSNCLRAHLRLLQGREVFLLLPEIGCGLDPPWILHPDQHGRDGWCEGNLRLLKPVHLLDRFNLHRRSSSSALGLCPLRHRVLGEVND